MYREVAQAGSAPGLGPGGRRFESCLPDKKRLNYWVAFLFPAVEVYKMVLLPALASW